MGGFKASPLSIAVPEGAFKEWVDEEVTRSNRRAHGQGGHPGTSTSSGWNWPKVNRLTVQDLTGQGREWVDFLGLKSGLQSSYGFTRKYQEIRERIDDNVSRFIVNYMRSTMVLACCLLCERPESLVGIVVILGIMDWFIQFSARTSLDRQSTLYQILSLLVTLVIWVVVFLSKAMASIFRSLLLVGLLVLVHASFRLPQDLERRRLRERRKKTK